MDLSGRGAIPLEDVHTLQSGVLMILPKDVEGNSVIYVDRSKLLESDRISPRLVFFVLQRMMDNELSAKNGFVALINLSNPFGATWQKDNVAKAKDLVRKAMLVKVGQIHVVCSPPVQGCNSFVSSCKSSIILRKFDSPPLLKTSHRFKLCSL